MLTAHELPWRTEHIIFLVLSERHLMLSWQCDLLEMLHSHDSGEDPTEQPG